MYLTKNAKIGSAMVRRNQDTAMPNRNKNAGDQGQLDQGGLNPGRLGRDFQHAIGMLLRSHHRELIEEPVPEHLRRLIALLEERGGRTEDDKH